MNLIRDKLRESLKSILPIAGIVFLLSVTLTPMEPGTFLLFSMGVLCLILGMSIFTMGAEMSMQMLGDKIGVSLAKSRRVWLVALIGFVIGVMVTISEPDLQILAEQVGVDPKMLLILTVSAGVGVFLALALFRIVLKVPLRILLIVSYVLTIGLCFFVPRDYWAVAFDSGGVTTGPMTVPFIMALGAGVSGVRAGSSSRDDSFGLVALCSIGPILSVMILGICYGLGEGSFDMAAPAIAETTRAGAALYLRGLWTYAGDVLRALLPILVFTVLFEVLTRSFNKTQMIRIGIGVLYTFVGLVIFLTGANVGFMPTGYELGTILAGKAGGWLLIPVGMLLGYFIVLAEPSVYVLNKQVERISAGAISAGSMGLSLSIGVAAALGLSMLRILTGIPILYILLPGYLLALILTFFVPPFFTGIAFDSGGVASGTMMSAFVLPMAIGACCEVGGNVMTQAFGCVAFVALTPILSIQVCGLIYNMKSHHAAQRFITEEEVFLDYTLETLETHDAPKTQTSVAAGTERRAERPAERVNGMEKEGVTNG